MSNLYFTKQPSEIYSVDIDFVDRLGVGETILTQTVTAIETTGGTDKTSTVISASIIDGTKVTVKVKAGTDGVDYKITVKITTSGSNTLEEDVRMIVREE